MATADLRPTYTIGQDFVRLSAQLPVRAQRLAAQQETTPHDHEFYEIALVTGGRGVHLTSEGRETIRRGDVLILNPNCVHGYPKVEKLSLINLYYLADWFLAETGPLHHSNNLVSLFFGASLYASTEVGTIVRLRLKSSEFARMEGEAMDLLDAQTQNRSLLYRESCFFKLIDSMARAAQAQGWCELLPVLRPEVDHALRFIESITLRHETFDADDVAKRAGISPGHLSRLVQEQIGMSPSEYYQRHRIRLVCRRLLATKLSITEIAYEAGFADAAHLNRHFRKYRDTTPGEYREKFQPD